MENQTENTRPQYSREDSGHSGRQADGSFNVTMKQLLEAGVHFGHQSRRWNPKMKPFIYTERNGIYIIDLKKSLKMIRDAYNYVRDAVADGKRVLFVGTKKQAKESIYNAATGCNQYYVINRWLGGMMTNFQTIRKSIARLKELDKMIEDGTIDQFKKKEQAMLLRERNHLDKYLAGVKHMDRPPDIVFIVDPHKEQIAVRECQRMKIPIVAVVDTNCDPDPIDVIIPGNDDAIRAIKLIAQVVADACTEGMMSRDGVDFMAEGAGTFEQQQQTHVAEIDAKYAAFNPDVTSQPDEVKEQAPVAPAEPATDTAAQEIPDAVQNPVETPATPEA